MASNRIIIDYKNRVNQDISINDTIKVLVELYYKLKACGYDDVSARTAVADVCDSNTRLTTDQHVMVLNGVSNHIMAPKANFTPWSAGLRSTDYLVNQSVDRDTNAVKMHTSLRLANRDSKASYKPGMSNFEDLFGNNVISPQEYSTNQRFNAPSINTRNRANAGKYETFQA